MCKLEIMDLGFNGPKFPCRGTKNGQFVEKVARRKKFRFEAFWAKDGKCKEIVRGAYENNGEGNPVETWNIKINVCRANLTRWSSVKFKQRRRQIN
ncbi:hypothetical protein ACFX2A_026643 [Malus domestica]